MFFSDVFIFTTVLFTSFLQGGRKGEREKGGVREGEGESKYKRATLE